jgi:hypothetical protein
MCGLTQTLGPTVLQRGPHPQHHTAQCAIVATDKRRSRVTESTPRHRATDGACLLLHSSCEVPQLQHPAKYSRRQLFRAQGPKPHSLTIHPRMLYALYLRHPHTAAVNTGLCTPSPNIRGASDAKHAPSALQQMPAQTAGPNQKPHSSHSCTSLAAVRQHRQCTVPRDIHCQLTAT